MAVSSPESPEFLVVGKIRRPHGLHGEVLMEVYTDFPQRLTPGRVVYLGEQRERLIICQRRTHKDGLLLTFDGFHTPEAVERFENRLLYVSAAEVAPLPDGVYYHHQLLGMKIVNESGRNLGLLTEILVTGANDVYVVSGENGEILLPAIEEVVREVDLAGKVMKVHLLPGLVDGEVSS